LVFGLCVIAAPGCGGTEQVPLVPVSGAVKLGGAAMPMGMVEFHPDAGKGNTFKGKPVSMIKSDGTYKLHTDGREGAPAGWYKVTVSGHGMPEQMPTDSKKAPAEPAVNAKYSKPDASGFSFEVKEGAPAGAYDISMIK
jgi:hypothetical protein